MTCECGCGTELDGRRSGARYASDACRARAWKARTGYRRERAAGTTGNGNARQRPKRRRSPDRRVTLSRAVAAVQEGLREDGPDPTRVGAWLERALPSRLRDAA
jgi:hypothetical protein